MQTETAARMIKLLLLVVLASTCALGVSCGNLENPGQGRIAGSVTDPAGEGSAAEECIELDDWPETGGGSGDCTELDEPAEAEEEPRACTEVLDWPAAQAGVAALQISLESQELADPAEQEPAADVPGGDINPDPEEPPAKSQIVMECGEEREFPLSGEGSADRTIKFTETIDANIHPTVDQMIAYCQAKKPRLCRDVIQDAKRDALASCRRRGREIADSVSCGEISSEGTAAGSGSGEDDCDSKPVVKQLRCELVEPPPLAPPETCEWSAKVLSNKIIRRKYSWKWRDANGVLHRSCGVRLLRRIKWECTAEFRYAKAAGSLKLACSAPSE